MNEFLLGAGKPTLPGPTGDIQGTVQRMGAIKGMTIVWGTRAYAARGKDVWFAGGGRYGTSNGSIVGYVYKLDLESLTVTSAGQNSNSGLQDGLMDLNDDASRLWLYGGNYNNSQSIALGIDTATNVTVAGSWGSGRNSMNHGHGVNGQNVYILGNNATTFCYRIDIPGGTTTQLTARVPSAANKGFSCCQVGLAVYMTARDTGTMYKFDITTETFTSIGVLGRQCWSDGVYDGQGNIYWLVGTDTYGLSSIIKHNLADNSKTTITIKGDMPNWSAYFGNMLKVIWYKGGIYFFRCDLNTADGLQLYRII